MKLGNSAGVFCSLPPDFRATPIDIAVVVVVGLGRLKRLVSLSLSSGHSKK